mgnify:CR=1 FL=1
MKAVMKDFCVFWNIRVPAPVIAWFNRVINSRTAQDAALYGMSIVAVSLLASGVLA